MIHVLVQHPTPYFDDSYAVNSANNGPYGDAICAGSHPAPGKAIPCDRAAVGYWRDRYDLRFIMQRDWASLGPKLRGKIHITSGTMDNGYLNNAVYQMEEFLRGTATPAADAEIIYGERREHCFTGDTERPNMVGGRTVHQRFMPVIAGWMKRTAPAGADTTSWVY